MIFISNFKIEVNYFETKLYFLNMIFYIRIIQIILISFKKILNYFMILSN
jgi:hypothetical protein